MVKVDGGRATEVDASATAPTAEREPTRAHATLPPRRAALVLIHPVRDDEPPVVFRVNGERWIGRSRNASFHVEDARVSRRHATFEPRGEGLFVRDDGSRHGTFVNRSRVSGAGILARFGDVVRVGELLLHAVSDSERHSARPRRIDGASLGLKGVLLAGPELGDVWDEAQRISTLREPVLILGESGSGKECVARLLHGPTAAGPFIGLNVSAVPETLFEAEIFGCERGAFTGAHSTRAGAFREACGGTLFLDEVAELKLESQAKLLRALDGGHVRPLGSKGDVPVDARVLSATNRDLERACETGHFREDLYYRLSGLVLRVPPLRERRGDILLIAGEVLRQCAGGLRFSTDAASLLVTASWHGNTRELRHAVAFAAQRATLQGEPLILPEHLRMQARQAARSETLTSDRIEQALTDCGGIASRAARMLGISRTTLYKNLKLLEQDKAAPVAAMERERVEGNGAGAHDR
jgi:DNA-binding NtrC family response regulator